jgi:hypothetical protein
VEAKISPSFFLLLASRDLRKARWFLPHHPQLAVPAAHQVVAAARARKGYERLRREIGEQGT